MPILEFSILENTEYNAIAIEKLRHRSYKVENVNLSDLIYAKEIIEGKILVFVCKIDENIVATCYVSDLLNSLYVEYLFVQPEYQKSGLKLGIKLLQYIINNKHLAEEYFGCKFSKSKLTPSNEGITKIYEEEGYKIDDNDITVMTKRI